LSEHNPYRPGKARVSADAGTSPDNKRPAGLLIAAILEAWTAGYTAWTAPSTLREFKKLFEGFGAGLPSATKVLLAAPQIWSAFSLLGLALLVWIAVRAQPDAAERRKMKLSLWIFGVLFGLTVAWAAFALYVPIFKLGSVV
jgi:hypothetical protein